MKERASDPLRDVRIGGVALELASEDLATDGVDAIVLEDDTYFVLSAEPEFRESKEHPIRIWTELHESQAATPGSVVVREGRPMRMLAVVHDLSSDPSWRECWISQALAEVLRVAEARDVRHIAVQVLGNIHGRLEARRFVGLLRQSLEHGAALTIDRVSLIPGRGGRRELAELLSELADRSDPAEPEGQDS